MESGKLVPGNTGLWKFYNQQIGELNSTSNAINYSNPKKIY